MRKFYLMMLAMLCVAGTAMAGRSTELKTTKALQSVSAKSIVKKEAKTNLVKSIQAPVKATPEKFEKLGGVKVTGMRKAGNNTNASIEGTWIFYLGDYYFDDSEGLITCEFEATLDGNEVMFEDPSGTELPFVAEYDEGTGTLTFDRLYLGKTGTYYIYQEPFVWVNTIVTQPIVATYYAADGLILFDEDNGISWVAYSNQAGTTKVGYFSIYDLIGAEAGSTWQELGEASFRENVIYGTFTGKENTTYTTHKIYESIVTPGVYKVIDPFAALYAELGFSSTSPQMLIDATDPDNVKIEIQSTGINGGTDGLYYYFNEGWYCAEYDEELDESLICTLTKSDDGLATITIPYHSCTVYASTAGSFYYGSAYESTLTFQLPVAEEEIETVGTYDMSILPTGIYGEKTGDAVTIQVEVKKQGADYWIVELGSTNYFNDQYIHFTYNDANYATFTASYAGEFDGQPTWFAPFVFNGSFTEPQENYGVTFDAETGFNFPGNSGFAWFITSSAEVFDAQDVYAAFYVTAPQYADASIVDEWNFTLNGHYLGSYSLGQFTETFTATLDGNTVTFESTGSVYHIVGEFTSPTTIEFKKGLVGSSVSTYGLWQVPYVNNAGVEDVEELESEVVEAVVATYNAEEGTIEFSENSGLLYGYFNNATGAFSYWDDAYDFVTAKSATATGVKAAEAKTEKAEVVYYDLNGRRVNVPKAGLYIKKSGNTVQKVVID